MPKTIAEHAASLGLTDPVQQQKATILQQRLKDAEQSGDAKRILAAHRAIVEFVSATEYVVVDNLGASVSYIDEHGGRERRRRSAPLQQRGPARS